MTKYVFVSHSSKDCEHAEMILNYLESSIGVKCWISYRDLIGGSNYQECIVEAIESCSCMVLLYSINSESSEDVKKELQLAQQYSKYIVPCNLDGRKMVGQFNYILGNTHWIDFKDDREKKLINIGNSVKRAIWDKEKKNAVECAKEIQETLRIISKGASPDLIQILIDQGYELFMLVKRSPVEYSDDYHKFVEIYGKFTSEIQRVIQFCDGDIANNNKETVAILNEMIKILANIVDAE